jgi:hypothetical protein
MDATQEVGVKWCVCVFPLPLSLFLPTFPSYITYSGRFWGRLKQKEMF